MSLSQRNSMLDAFLTASEELITQFRSRGSCGHCTVEFGWGHGHSVVTLSPWSIRLVQRTSVLRQLHAALIVWVGEVVGGQCFRRLSTPTSSFQGDVTESQYFTCHKVHNSTKLWFAVSSQGQMLPISRLGVSLVHWSRVPRASWSVSGKKVWERTGFSVRWGSALSQLLQEQRSRLRSLKEVMMSSHLTLWGRKHVGYLTMENQGVKTERVETVELILIGNSLKQRREIIQYSERKVLTWQFIKKYYLKKKNIEEEENSNTAGSRIFTESEC